MTCGGVPAEGNWNRAKPGLHCPSTAKCACCAPCSARARPQIQSCQPLCLCFGHSLLHPRTLHYAAVLLIISLRSPPQKHFKNIFNLMCVWASTAPATSCECAFFVYVVLVVPYWHPHFKPADQLQCSVGFLLLCVSSWRDYFCFSHFKRPH